MIKSQVSPMKCIPLLIVVGLLFIPAKFCLAQSIVDLQKQFSELSPEDQVKAKEISDKLRCPTCTGLSVLQSDAPFSLQIREAVLSHVKEGKSEDSILAFFTKRYGLWILREPPSEGFHLIAWFIPIGFMVFGALGLWFFVWRKQKKQIVGSVRSREDILKEMEMNIEQARIAFDAK